jgi:alpha-glucosidase
VTVDRSKTPAYAAAFVMAVACLGIRPAAAQQGAQVASPDGKNVVTVETRDGGFYYSVRHEGRPLLLPSRLGFVFRGNDSLYSGLRITGTSRDSADVSWTQPWGEVARVRDHHNELRVGVAEERPGGRRFAVVFRVFDGGIGFRYEVSDSGGLGDFELMEELTEFTMADNAKAWWIPANVPSADRQEFLYSSGPVSRIDTVQVPLTMETTSGPDVVIHEADLEDYAGMYLVGTGGRTLRITLPRWKNGVAVKGHAPFVTPWRTIQIADRVEDLAPSVLGLNLNPPSKIKDTSWIKPMKYDGIWWGMHIGLYTWSSGPKHGATTERTERYIDFAAANGLGGTLAEGWNVGWDGDWTKNGALFSFTKAYPDFDLPAVAAYAQSKGVTLIGHNETSSNVSNYERQLEDAFSLYERLGIHAVKTGYVGDTTDLGHAHQGQYMVRHQRHVIEVAAQHHLMLDAHEPIRDTGERRTWPNMMSREGARGQEYNAWSVPDGGNPPEHETILFFTRLLAGPMDFTPGIFDLLIQRPTGQPRTPEDPRPRTTLAKQLALYVVLYSPVQMAADLPENYEGQPAFQFIRDVAVDWDTTVVLKGKIGDYVIVARKQKSSPDWFLGAITDEQPRSFDVPLTFLPQGKKYVAEIYADGPNANWRDNPLPVAISRRDVTAGSTLHVVMAAGGGQAVRIRPAATGGQ